MSLSYQIKLSDMLAEFIYIHDFLDELKYKELQNYLLNSVEWESSSIKIYGNLVPVPRLTKFYGIKPYKYSGIDNYALDFPEPLKEVLNYVNFISSANLESHRDYNSILLNYYRSGKDSISWHSDNEKELGDNPNIASLSLGAGRDFLLKHVGTNTINKIFLEGNSLLLMGNNSQTLYKHCLPKTAKDGQRINLTFRSIY